MELTFRHKAIAVGPARVVGPPVFLHLWELTKVDVGVSYWSL